MFLLYNKSLDFPKPYKSFIPCQVIFNLRLIPAQWLKPFRNGSVLKNLLPKQVIHKIRFLRNNLFILNISRKKTNSHRIIRICRPKIVFKDLFKTFFRLKLSLLEAKLCRFLLLQLTWNTLYTTDQEKNRKLFFNFWTSVPLRINFFPIFAWGRMGKLHQS